MALNTDQPVGFSPFWEASDEVVGIGGLGSLFSVLLAGSRPAKADVEADGGGKQHRLLADQAHLGAQPGQRQLLDVNPIQ